MRKRILVLFLALVMCLTLMPMGAMAADLVDSGKCGDGLTWSLNSDGLLTVSGTGRIPDYYFGIDAEDMAPWESHKSEIKSVVIEDGVTYIGGGAFYQCENLETVVIGNDVKAMDGLPFACCNIKTVTFGSSIEHIQGFYGNPIREVILPASFKELGINAFYNCGLVSVKFLGDAPTDRTCLFGLCNDVTIMDDSRKITLYIPQGNTTWTDSELYDADAQTFCGFHTEFYNVSPVSPDEPGGKSGNFFSSLLESIRSIFKSLFSWLPFC